MGPHFPTFFYHNSRTPEKIFDDKHHYLNISCEPGEITTSDHFPVIIKLSTKFLIEKQKVYITNNADWDLFQNKLDTQVHLTNLDGNTIEESLNWLKTVKNAMDAAIPISLLINLYTSLKQHLKLQNLKTNIKLSEFAEHFGRTIQIYRGHQRIKFELRDRCKEA